MKRSVGFDFPKPKSLSPNFNPFLKSLLKDFNVFGIAPRHYRTRREYDDRHIFETLSEALGGKSVIPAANDILKRMLIPGGTSLADRLLRRMGWKSEEVAEVVAEDESENNIVLKSPQGK